VSSTQENVNNSEIDDRRKKYSFHYNNAPINEALIDIQVAVTERATPDALNSKYALISDLYPKHDVIHLQQLGIHNQEGKPTSLTMNHGIAGYRYSSQDQCNVVQFRTDGFTFSRLKPYDSWESMKMEAEKLWNIYVEAVSPNTITRVGTRYINILKVPNGTDIGEYLSAPPQIPENLPQKIDNFLTRIHIRDPLSEETHGFLTQALEKIQQGHASIVLDIDVFVAKSFNPTENDFWEKLEELRHFKNMVFKESIGQKAEELFA